MDAIVDEKLARSGCGGCPRPWRKSARAGDWESEPNALRLLACWAGKLNGAQRHGPLRGPIGHVDKREKKVARGREVAIMLSSRARNTVCGTGSGPLLGCGEDGKPRLTRENTRHVAQWSSACLACRKTRVPSLAPPTKRKTEDADYASPRFLCLRFLKKTG